MPKTAAILKANLETNEDFLVRRIRWVEEAYIKEKLLPMKTAFVNRALIYRYVTSGNRAICQALEGALTRLREFQSANWNL
jgi:hypothetical protein